jgi:DNA-binding NtrC family response regulator
VAQRAYVMAAGDTITDEWLPTNAPGTSGAVTERESDGNSIRIRLGTSLPEAERQLIEATLQHFDNHKERTAAVLGVSLKTLYNRLKEYTTERDRIDPGEGASIDRPL